MNLMGYLPPLLVDEELNNKLMQLPPIANINDLSKSERLLRILDVYDIFIPSQLTKDTYNNLYYQLYRSFQRKQTLIENNQLMDNRDLMRDIYRPKGINGCDSSLLCGTSGLGKTSSVQRIVEILTNNQNIIIDKPYVEIVPILFVEASPISSVKGFFLDILRALDNALGTNYYQANNRTTINGDMLLGAVSNALLLHCGILIIDECDRFLSSHKSSTMVNYIVELMNCSGVSVLFVGTNGVINFFNSNPYICRRGMGTIYKPMEYGDEYIDFLKRLFKYQYTLNKVELNSELSRCIYDLTNGIQALIIQLFVETQKLAITSDYEKIDASIINKAFKNSMSIMSPYLVKEPIKLKKINEPKILDLRHEESGNDDSLFPSIEECLRGKNKPNNALYELKKYIDVIEIKL